MERFIEIVLSNVLFALGLAVLATLLKSVWKNPHLTHALWLLVLIKLVTPPLVNIPISKLPAPHNDGDQHIATVNDSLTSTSVQLTADEFEQSVLTEAVANTIAPSKHVPVETTPKSTAMRDQVATAGVVTWGFGVLLFLFMLLRKHLALHRFLADARMADQKLQNAAIQLADKMGLKRIPVIKSVNAEICPMVTVNFLRPTIILPDQLLNELSHSELQTVIGHELAHIRRKDHWVRAFEIAVLVIQWWNVIAWWASWKLRQAEEECCDAYVVWLFPEGRRSYGQALLKTIEFLTEKPPLKGIGLTFGKSLFHRRIEMIMSRSIPHRISKVALGVLLVIMVGILPLSAQTRDGAVNAKPQAAQKTAEAADDANQFVISGVCENALHEPVAGVKVRLLMSLDRAVAPKQVEEIVSDQNGRYRFEHLQPPVFNEQANRSRMYQVVATHPDLSSDVRNIFTPQTHRQNLVLRKRGTLSGVVVNEEQEPVPGAVIYHRGFNSQPTPGVWSGVTDQFGNFEIDDLFRVSNDVPQRILNLRFHVAHPDYGVQPVNVSEIPGDKFVVLTKPAVVEGVVTDSVTGKPAADVRISAQGISHGMHYAWSETWTDSEGHYQLLLIPDQYNIWATMENRIVVAHDSFNAQIGRNEPADFDLVEGGFIVGKVLDLNGEPFTQIGNVALMVGLHGPARPSSGAAVNSAQVQQDGTYKIRVAPGENFPYLMTTAVSADRNPRNSRDWEPVAVQEGETKVVDIHVHAQVDDRK